jgi:hypothetical protein
MPIVPTLPFYTGTGPYMSVGTATSVANLPNRSGSTLTVLGLQPGAIYQVGAAYYCCYDGTSGSAIWFLLGSPRNPNGGDRIQTNAASTVTIGAGIDRLVSTYAGAVTVTLPSVLGGAPIGTKITIQKASTNAGGYTITPDAGASINGAAADATQAMVTANATASTTVSAAGTNDVSAVFIRDAALSWRSTLC